MTKQLQSGIECDGTDMFVVFHGVRVAKRGHPGTPHAGTWISLEPGFVVFSSPDMSELIVEKNGVRLQ